ncbi:hypothetical protein HDU98_005150, partial [Podochytrium sp. JEL0797]
MPTPTTESDALQTLLVDMGLAQLKGLPGQLEAEHSAIEARLSLLAATEHRAFLLANACGRDIGEKAQRAGAMLVSLEEDENDEGLVLDTAARDTAATLTGQLDTLRDLLDTPALFAALVRLGAYEDALELRGFVVRVALRFPQSKAVKTVSQKVHAATENMAAQLVATLRSSAKLPQCIRVIGFLRRLQVYSTHELSLVFLQQKNNHFKAILDDIKESDPQDYLKRYIEVSRDLFFDIITQYKAIFADSNTSTLHQQQQSTQQPSPTVYYPSTSPSTTNAILASYVTETTSHFLAHLESTLAKINDTQSLSSLLTQTMYYGLSLARISVDIRPLLPPPFIKSTERIFNNTLDAGLQ